MKIIIVRLSAIGDCVLLFSAARALLKAQKDTEVTWLIGKSAFQLFKRFEHPRLKFVVIDKPKKIRDFFALKRQFSEQKFDVLLAMQASFRANLIYPFIKANRKIGFDKARARDFQQWFVGESIEFAYEHLHESFLRFFKEISNQQLTCSVQDWEIPLIVNGQQLLEFKLKEPYVVINPAASKLERSWFARNYAALIDYIFERYSITAVLTGSNADFEMELCQKIESLCRFKPINICGKTNLQQLAFILKKASLCIAPDTGPAHIADAQGAPVIGLYAVVSSRLSGPYHNRHLTIDKFDQAVTQILDKNLNAIDWKTRVHDRRAMELISVQEVCEKINEVLG